MKKNEYQGGAYALIEAFGALLLYLFYVLIQKKKNLSYLSGEEEYPNINKKKRLLCLIVGVLGIILVIMLFFTLLCIE